VNVSRPVWRIASFAGGRPMQEAPASRVLCPMEVVAISDLPVFLNHPCANDADDTFCWQRWYH